jgi:hypothetical protein
MTFVGKILVIVIMAFSLLFLGISSVVFTTSKNWMTATKEEKQKVDDLKKKLVDAQAVSDSNKKLLDDAKGSFDALAKQLNSRIAALEAENKLNIDSMTSFKAQAAVAETTAKSTLDEVEAKRKETELLRVQKSSVEKQANEFKLHQAELNDKIRELERQLESATKNNSDLRERVARFSVLLRQNGLSDDISRIKGQDSPPPVQGEVKRIDPTNRVLEISIGSDDGLVEGHKLYVYRLSPRPEFLGEVMIKTVDPDQAVAKVVGNTFQGKKIREGDIVSSTIKSKF